MDQEFLPEKWVGNPSTHFMLAALFLVLGTAWLLALQGDLLSYWLPSGLLLATGAVLLVRGILQLRARRSNR